MGGASLLYQAGAAVTSGVVDMVLCLGARHSNEYHDPRRGQDLEVRIRFSKAVRHDGSQQSVCLHPQEAHAPVRQNPRNWEKLPLPSAIMRIKNPNAYLKTPLTLDQYLGSRMIADPIRMFDACIQVNGGLGFVVASNEKARRLRKDGAVKVLELQSLTIIFTDRFERPDITYLGIADSAKKAFERSGVKRSDVSFFQPYDDYTIAVLMQIRRCRDFAKREKAASSSVITYLSYNGDFPVNTGARSYRQVSLQWHGGMVHIVESVRQSAGRGGERQVKRRENSGCDRYRSDCIRKQPC